VGHCVYSEPVNTPLDPEPDDVLKQTDSDRACRNAGTPPQDKDTEQLPF
jgi:hypothetical protein